MSPNIPSSDFRTYYDYADLLASGQVDWKLVVGRMTTLVPGYIYFLAALLKLFGHSALVARIANAILGGLTVLLVHLIAERVFDRKVALIASLVYALLPVSIFYASLTGTETYFTFLMMAGLYAWLLVEGSRRGWGMAVLAGVLFGLAALTRSQGLILLGGLFFAALWRRRVDLMGKWFVACAVAFMIMLPWLVRNQMLYGSFNLQLNGGMFLWQANHEGAPLPVGEFPWEAKNLPYKPISSEFYAYRTREASDWALDRAKEYFAKKPLEAAKGIIIKAEHFLADDPDGIFWNQVDDSGPGGKVTMRPISLWGKDSTALALKVERSSYKVLLAAALLGTIVAVARRRGRFMLMPVVAWLSFHALTMAMVRYRFPLYSIYSIYAGLGIAFAGDLVLEAFSPLRKSGSPRTSPA